MTCVCIVPLIFIHCDFSYVTGEAQYPLVIHGLRGCGKSTLIARAAQCCHSWLPEALLLVRFVSISAQSHTTEQLLRSIVDQCSVLTYGHQSWVPHVSLLVSVICLRDWKYWLITMMKCVIKYSVWIGDTLIVSRLNVCLNPGSLVLPQKCYHFTIQFPGT